MNEKLIIEANDPYSEDGYHRSYEFGITKENLPDPGMSLTSYAKHLLTHQDPHRLSPVVTFRLKAPAQDLNLLNYQSTGLPEFPDALGGEANLEVLEINLVKEDGTEELVFNQRRGFLLGCRNEIVFASSSNPNKPASEIMIVTVENLLPPTQASGGYFGNPWKTITPLLEELLQEGVTRSDVEILAGILPETLTAKDCKVINVSSNQNPGVATHVYVRETWPEHRTELLSKLTPAQALAAYRKAQVAK